MPELVKAGRIYIAQPPLYQVMRNKKSEYVLNEGRMRSVLSTLGLDGAALIVRDDQHNETHRLEGDRLRAVFDLLEALNESVTILQRRGIALEQLLALRSDDPQQQSRLPHIRLQVLGQADHFFWSEEDEDRYRQEHAVQSSDPDMDKVIGEHQANGQMAVRQELHETRQLDRIFSALSEFGLSIDDYVIQQEESASGETLPTRFELVAADAKGQERRIPIVDLRTIVPGVLEAGKHGMEIKRFKGLGEMDAEQLWTTTMDPQSRVLLRVTWDDASQAEQLFSILMGEEVEPRRKYIEDHALEVKNLDV